MSKREKHYRLTYKIDHHDPPLPKSKIPPEHGAADSIFLVSILDYEDGLDMRLLSRDGEKPAGGDDGQLEPNERFKVWLCVAAMMAKDPELDGGRRALAKTCLNLCFSAFNKSLFQHPDMGATGN